MCVILCLVTARLPTESTIRLRNTHKTTIVTFKQPSTLNNGKFINPLSFSFVFFSVSF